MSTNAKKFIIKGNGASDIITSIMAGSSDNEDDI